jgi:hypothetical protein
MLHVVGLPSAKDTYKPAPFIPAGARATDLLAVNDVLYTSTTGKCGGSADAVYAMDLASDTRPVVSYKTTGSPVGAVALTTDGTVVVVVTNGVVTLDPKTLAVKQAFTDNATTFVTGAAGLHAAAVRTSSRPAPRTGASSCSTRRCRANRFRQGRR